MSTQTDNSRDVARILDAAMLLGDVRVFFLATTGKCSAKLSQGSRDTAVLASGTGDTATEAVVSLGQNVELLLAESLESQKRAAEKHTHLVHAMNAALANLRKTP